MLYLFDSSQHYVLPEKLTVFSCLSSLYLLFSSVQLLSCVQLFVIHEPQHARPPCPSPTPRVHPNPCPLSWWCHPTILSSVVPFSSCPQSFPASGSFPVNQLFTSGGQSNEHPGLISFGMDWLDLLAVQGTLKSSLTPQFKSINSSVLSFQLSLQSNSHIHT